MIIKAFGGLCAALLITTVIVLKGIIKNNIVIRHKYFIMLTNMGVRREDVKKMIFMELFIKIVLFAFVGSIVVYPLLIFTKNMIYYAVSQQITVNPLSVVLSSVIATILFLIITFFETFTVSKLITKEKVNHYVFFNNISFSHFATKLIAEH